MPAIDLLRKMRGSGYGAGSDAAPKKERSLELDPQEAQGLQDGQQVTATVIGTFKDGCLYPQSVQVQPPEGAAPQAQEPVMVRNNVQQLPG